MEEFDVVVIGAGPGGYVAAIRAAQLGLKTACIEEKDLGGTCLNVGCIPSKTLLHETELFWQVKKRGIADSLSPNIENMLKEKKRVIKELQGGIGGLFKKNKVTHIKGRASFIDPNTILAGEQKVSARFFIIATGSSATELPFLPFDEEKVLSSTGALELRKVPKKLAVIGAGAIGLELGSMFLRLGSEVEVIEFLDRACPGLDSALSKGLQSSLEAQGMQFHFSTKVVTANAQETLTLTLEKEQVTRHMVADAVLVSIGRKPFTEGLALEKAGIDTNEQGQIPVDGNFKTVQPHILAIGDVIDGPMLAHKASEEGVAAAEMLAEKGPTIQYVSIPNVVYTFPEVASVGLTEKQVKEQNIPYTIGNHSLKANARAKCMQEEEGFIKILAHKETDKLLGVHILSPHASELIAQGAIALSKGMSAKELGETPAAHPSLSESLTEASLAIHNKAIHK